MHVGYVLKRIYTVKDGKISGRENCWYRYNIRSVSAAVPYTCHEDFHSALLLTGFRGARIRRRDGDAVLFAGSEANNSIDINFVIGNNKSYSLSAFDFKFDIPPDYQDRRGWLCGCVVVWLCGCALQLGPAAVTFPRSANGCRLTQSARLDGRTALSAVVETGTA